MQPGRDPGQHAGIMLASLALAACAGAPAPIQQGDVSRVHGCWVEKSRQDGRVDAFLRLLPDRTGAATYTGGLSHVRGIKPSPPIAVTIARDGSRVTIVGPGSGYGPPSESFVAARPDWAPADGAWLVYRTETAPTLFLLIEATGEALRIATTLGPEQGPIALSPIFEGERDGCD